MPEMNTQTPVSPKGQFFLGLYLALVTLSLAYFVVKVWPSVPAPAVVQNPGASTGTGTPPPAKPSDSKASETAKVPDGQPKDKTMTSSAAASNSANDLPKTEPPRNDAKPDSAKPNDSKPDPQSPPTSGSAAPLSAEARRIVQMFGGAFEFSI